MDNTGRFDLPLILPSQAQKHVTHNEALTLIDGLFHLVIKTFGETAPPVTAQIDDAFVVGASPTGAWFGQAGSIAFNSVVGWRFLSPRQGIIALNAATAKLVVYDQSAWKALGDAIDVSTLGINTNADAVNRLAVRSNAALFIALNAGDGGSGNVQIKLSKELASDTASHLFQTAFSGRAEIGLTGDDDFHLKVSPNGATWNEAIKVDKTTALVTLTNNSVSNAALIDMASARIKGRTSAGTGDPEDLSGTQVTAMLDAFNSSAKGAAPASGGGTLNFLRADGTWATPISGGEVNTASNVNAGGSAIYKQKTGVNLEFRGINAGSNKVTVALDAANNEIDVDVAEANLTLGNLGGSIDLSGSKASGILAAARFPALTGDVTNTPGTLAATIATGAVSNAKMANVPTATFKGRTGAGTGSPEDLTSAQATALIDIFSTTLKGHAPASGGGTANFLRADGTWAALQNLATLGINATADATNKLAVNSAAALFNNVGNGVQIKLNKAGATDSASFLFQDGFSGRAEIGLTGDDDFHFKVSSDGLAFFESLLITRSNGLVTVKNGFVFDPQAADPVTPANGQVWYNSTLAKFRKRENGASSDLAPASGGVSDGDKGDITVSGAGVVWTINAQSQIGKDLVLNSNLFSF